MEVLVGVHLFINTDALQILRQFRYCFFFSTYCKLPFSTRKTLQLRRSFFFTKVEVITNGVQRDHSLETVGVINNPFASFTKSTKTRSSSFLTAPLLSTQYRNENKATEPTRGSQLGTAAFFILVLNGGVGVGRAQFKRSTYFTKSAPQKKVTFSYGLMRHK